MYTAPSALSPLLGLAGTVASKINLSDGCVSELFTQRHIFHATCLKGLISKCLGVVMTTASAIVKMPQIRNMLKAGSASGLAPASVYSETFMYLCSVVYFVGKDLRDDGKLNDFADYGENVNLAAQNAIIMALMWWYNGSSPLHIAMVCASFAAFMAWGFTLPMECGPIGACADAITQSLAAEATPGVCWQALSQPCQALLMALPMPLMLFARVPQILANFRNGHTGILSVVTLSMNTLGSCARMFTCMNDKSGLEVDMSAFFVYALSFACNATMALQCVAFKEKTKAVLAAKGKKD